MASRVTLPPVSIRRHRVQRRVALHRPAIAAAWTNFEAASIEAQAKAHRAIEWTRSLSAIVAVVAAVVALRRVARRGNAGPAMRAVAAAGLLRRFVPVFRKLFSPYP